MECNDETMVLYNDNPDKMLDFIGCIGLIDFLLKKNLIYIHSQKDASVSKVIVATNAIPQNGASELFKEIKGIKYYYKSKGKEFPAINKSILNTNICKLVESLGNSLVYPMPLLIDYVNNDFKTEEQLSLEKQMKDTQKKHDQTMKTADNTLYWTRLAFVAAFVSTLCVIGFELYDRYIEKDLSIRELNKTIKESKIPAVITTKIENDTIKAIIINQHPQY